MCRRLPASIPTTNRATRAAEFPARPHRPREHPLHHFPPASGDAKLPVSCRSRCRSVLLFLLARARWRGEKEGEAVRESVRMRGKGTQESWQPVWRWLGPHTSGAGRRARAVLHRAQRRRWCVHPCFLCPPLTSTVLPAFLPRESLRPRLLQPHEQQIRRQIGRQTPAAQHCKTPRRRQQPSTA